MDNKPQNLSSNLLKSYFSYHFSYALPAYINSRPQHLAKVAEFFNIENLTKNLFAPYRRMVVREKTSLLDKLSFNLISIMVGACVRLILILTGFIVLALFFVFDYVSIIFYAIPFFSYPDFLERKQKTFFEAELENSKKFLEKISGSVYFQTVCQFFEKDFAEIFNSLPQPKSLGITTQQNLAQMLSVLAQNYPPLKTYLEKESIDIKLFQSFLEYLKTYLENPPRLRVTPIGQMLSFGYTNTLDRFSEELTLKALPPRQTSPELLEKVEEILTRPNSNNVLFVGEAGVGRHSALESLASAIAKYELPKLRDHRLILLDTIALLGSSDNMVEIKANFESLLLEAKHAGNIILAIDQIDKISSSLENHIDLSEVLNSTLADSKLPVIGITTLDDYNKFIRPNSEMTSLFEKVDIEEPETSQTLSILIAKTLEMYKKEKVSATLAALLEIVQKSQEIPDDRHQPEKSIILLEDCLNHARKTGKAVIDVTLADDTIASVSKIPVGKIKEGEKEKLKDLEGYLHKRIVGQEEAIIEIAKAMRRARSGIENKRSTTGSFLFLGPTGVGKTETAKALSEAYFGRESKMTRLDMTEFQGNDALERLIGNQETKTPGQLANLIRQNPYGVLLLDEFEKASIQVQNLFLQIIDEGHLTDAFGKKVAFTNIITIATSNAGAEFIREQVESGQTQELSKKLVDYVLSKNLFSPELLNRFDAVVVYKPLTPQEVTSVTTLLLSQLAKSLKETKNISLEITDSLAQTVAQKGFDPAFGARPIKHLIADKIEDGIAKMVISGEAQNGGTIPAATLLKFVS